MPQTPPDRPFARRRFLQSCACLAAAATTGRTVGAAEPEPIRRTGKPKFKFSLAAYSYRSLLKGNPAQLTLSDFIRDCADLGLEGTELTSYYFPKTVTSTYLNQLKRECFLLGLDVSGTAVGNDFGFPADSPRRKQQIEHVKQWVNYAQQLSAPVIRIFAGHQKKGLGEAEAHKLMVSAIEECCDYAGKHGVHLALENHGGPTSSAAGMMRFVRDVQSPWFGVNLDTGNFHSDRIYQELEQIAPYAINVQIKVTVSGADRKKRPADFARLAKILRGVGYRGYIVLEYEEAGDPRQESGRYLDQLREAFA